MDTPFFHRMIDVCVAFLLRLIDRLENMKKTANPPFSKHRKKGGGANQTASQDKPSNTRSQEAVSPHTELGKEQGGQDNSSHTNLRQRNAPAPQKGHMGRENATSAPHNPPPPVSPPSAVSVQRVEDKRGSAQVAPSRRKVYFSMPQKGYFLTMSAQKEIESLFQAEEVAPGRFEFTLIDVDRIKPFNVPDALSNLGAVMQHEATRWNEHSKGCAIEQEAGGRRYWKIEEKLTGEFY